MVYRDSEIEAGRRMDGVGMAAAIPSTFVGDEFGFRRAGAKTKIEN